MRETYEDEVAEAYSIPASPRAGAETIDVAVHDFLSSWLVEGKPLLATAYMSDRAFECMAVEMGDEEPFDYGMAPYEMILGLQAVNDELGKVERLADVVTGVRLRDPALTLVRQEHHAQFVLYGIQEDLAAAFDCANRNKIGKPPKLKRAPRGASFEDFDHFASIFYLERPKRRGETLALLWAKEEGYWKIVSYEVEPHGASNEDTMPDIRPTMETPEMERVAGDPELVAATEGVLEAWLVEKNIDKTLGYFAPSSFPCVNVYLEPGEAAMTTLAEQRSRIRFGLTRTSDHLGPVAGLDDIIGAVELFVPDVRIVTHDREEAYSLYSLPDWRGENARCGTPLEGVQSAPPEGSAPSYGRFYVSGMRIETVAGETVALLLGWIKEDGTWRIYAYKVAAP